MAFGDFMPKRCSPVMMDGRETNLRFISGAGIYTSTDEVFLLLRAPGIERHFCSGNWSNRFQPGNDMSSSPNYLPHNVGTKPGKFRLSFTVFGTVQKREYKGGFEIRQMRLFGRVVGTCQSDALREHKEHDCVYLFEGAFQQINTVPNPDRLELID